MPDDRLFHKRLGHSEKVTSLTDLEDLTWRGYILSADDFGVMRFSAISLQADNDRFASRPAKVIQRALEHVRDAGLIVTFDHQGRTYCAQPDWNDHQHVRHPRATINPRPSDELLEQFSGETRKLFHYWPGKKRGTFDEHSGNVSETVQHLARAGTCVTAHANGNGLGEGGAGGALSIRAGDFCEWYADAHSRLLGVGYIGNPNKDYDAALRVCGVLTDQEARDAATVWFGADDKFAKDGTRTITKFASRATGYLEKLKARGIA